MKEDRRKQRHALTQVGALRRDKIIGWHVKLIHG